MRAYRQGRGRALVCCDPFVPLTVEILTMNGFEFNKLLGAIILAMLVAMLSAFVARETIHPEPLEKNSYVVEGVGAETSVATAETPADKGPESIAPLLAAADVAAGQKYIRVCAACHSFEKGGANKVGPNLYGIVMNKHAHMDGFAYSDGMQALSGKKWEFEDLNHFLYSPRGYISGTKMAFAGIKNDKDRANVIAYLRTLADSPVALPSK